MVTLLNSSDCREIKRSLLLATRSAFWMLYSSPKTATDPVNFHSAFIACASLEIDQLFRRIDDHVTICEGLEGGQSRTRPPNIKDGTSNYKGIFVQFLTMWEKQILARAIWIQKENWGWPYIFRDNEATIIPESVKTHNNVWHFFFPNWSLVMSKKCVVTPNFLSWDFNSPCYCSFFPA